MRIDGVHLTSASGPAKPPSNHDPKAKPSTAKRDPNATVHRIGGGERVIGNKFNHATTYFGRLQTTVHLAVRQQISTSEIATSIETIKALHELIPDFRAVACDKVARGAAAQVWLEDRLIPIVKPFDHSSDKNPNPHIESRTVTATNGTKVDLDLYANNGSASLQGILNGAPEIVDLTHGYVFKRESRNSIRWYVEITIPSDPRLPEHLWGVRFNLRFDHTAEDRIRGFNRPEHLRPFPPPSKAYRELTGRRNGVEAANNSLKRNLLNGRARSIGRNAQHADLVLAALFNNKMAEMRHAAYSELELAA